MNHWSDLEIAPQEEVSVDSGAIFAAAVTLFASIFSFQALIVAAVLVLGIVVLAPQLMDLVLKPAVTWLEPGERVVSQEIAALYVDGMGSNLSGRLYMTDRRLMWRPPTLDMFKQGRQEVALKDVTRVYVGARDWRGLPALLEAPGPDPENAAKGTLGSVPLIVETASQRLMLFIGWNTFTSDTPARWVSMIESRCPNRSPPAACDQG